MSNPLKSDSPALTKAQNSCYIDCGIALAQLVEYNIGKLRVASLSKPWGLVETGHPPPNHSCEMGTWYMETVGIIKQCL